MIYIDTFRLMHQIVTDPGAYGFTDVTDPSFNGVTVCSNPNQYLFWDRLHPTTHGHELLAETIENAVPEPSSFVLVGSGIVGVAGLLRRKGRRASAETVTPATETTGPRS